jgi:hypothetical protein
MGIGRITGKLKNHVTSGKTRAITADLEKKFGFNLPTVLGALYGNEADVKKVAGLGHDGRKVLANAELIKQNLQDAVGGTVKLNQVLGDLYSRAGKGTLDIKKEQAKAWLETEYLVNGRLEEGLKYIQAMELEQKTHSQTMTYLQEKGVIDLANADTNADFRANDLRFKLTENQIKADIEYQNRRNQHILSYGRDALPDTLPRKQFDTINVFEQMTQKVKDFFNRF